MTVLLWPVVAQATFYGATDGLIVFVGLPLVVWFVVEFLSRNLRANRWLVFFSVLVIYVMVLVSWDYFSTPPTGNRYKRAKYDIDRLSSALEMYRIDNNAYPTTGQGLSLLVAEDAAGQDLPGMLLDPWGRAYVYRSPGYSGTFDLYTLGADRLPGGIGESADIGNWMKR